MNKLVSVPILVISILNYGCDTNNRLKQTGNLVCQLAVKPNQPCSAVLSLDSGEIHFNQKEKSFELIAHYNACYQEDKVEIRGDYELHSNESTYELELLAKEIRARKRNIDQFPRTIGLINLDKKSMQGRYIDIWAVIRTHTKPINRFPKVAVNCKSDLEILDK